MRGNSTINSGESEVLMDLVRIVRMIRASIITHRVMIFGITAATIMCGVLYVIVKPKSYTATTRILVDNRVVTSANTDTMVIQSKTDDALVRTQVEILRSDNIARRVIHKMQLLKEPDPAEGAPTGTAAADTPSDSSDGPPPPIDDYGDSLENSEGMLKALKQFRNSLTVTRAALASVIDIGITADDPLQAARIANAVVEAYLQDQHEANMSVARSASGWMRQRLQNLGTKARVISRAKPPLGPDGLGRSMALLLAGAGGLALGIMAAFARDILDTRVKTPTAVASITRKPCFGYLVANAPERRTLRQRLFTKSSDTDKDADKQLTANALLDWSVERPRSTTTHTLRRAAVELLSAESFPKVIGLTSLRPGEGKTVTSVNFARVVAQFNKKVLLVDAEFYSSQTTKLLCPKAKLGIQNAFLDAPFDKIIIPDHLTDMHFLPSVNKDDMSNIDVKVFSQALEKILDLAKIKYDVIILDLPPFVPVSDVHEMEHMCDGFLLVVETAGHTPEVLAKGMHIAGPIQDKMIGSVLSKADADTLRRHFDDVDGMYVSNAANYVDNKSRSVRRQRRAKGTLKKA